MKPIACLALPLLAVLPQLALASPPSPAKPDAATGVAEGTAPAPSGGIDNALMRAAIEAQKEQVKRGNHHHDRAADQDCPDCPEAARRHVHPTASEAPKVDCIHCIDRPASA